MEPTDPSDKDLSGLANDLRASAKAGQVNPNEQTSKVRAESGQAGYAPVGKYTYDEAVAAGLIAPLGAYDSLEGADLQDDPEAAEYLKEKGISLKEAGQPVNTRPVTVPDASPEVQARWEADASRVQTISGVTPEEMPVVLSGPLEETV